MKRLLCLALLSLSTAVLAESMTVQWTPPDKSCGGTDIQAGDIGDIEIYYSDQPIPGPVDAAEACATASSPPPAGLTPIVTATSDQTVTVTLDGGKDYYIRARVQHTPTGQWSGLSPEVVKNVPLGPMLPPVVVSLHRDGLNGS